MHKKIVLPIALLVLTLLSSAQIAHSQSLRQRMMGAAIRVHGRISPARAATGGQWNATVYWVTPGSKPVPVHQFVATPTGSFVWTGRNTGNKGFYRIVVHGGWAYHDDSESIATTAHGNINMNFSMRRK